MTTDDLPSCWKSALKGEFESSYFHELTEFVAAERRQHDVFPPEEDVFNAFRLTPLSQVRVVILGQDPYHDIGQAHGLCFSVRPGVKLPPSLRNIYKELQEDLGHLPANHGCLSSWADQGVLLLNTVLTVRAHEANSHQKKGWETFTDSVLKIVNEQSRVLFVLWGKPAQKKLGLIDERHFVIKSAHPSPLSARRGFFGSRPFSTINEQLESYGMPAINWELPKSA